MRFKAFIGFPGKKISVGTILLVFIIQASWLRGQNFPLKLSDNGKYFVDRYKNPFSLIQFIYRTYRVMRMHSAIFQGWVLWV